MSKPIQIGNCTIHRIVEQEGPFFDASTFFPTITKELLDENRGWLRPRFLDDQDKLMLCIQSYIVKTPHHTIMIDSCVGNHKPRPTRPFWNMMNTDRYEKNLAAAGFSVNDIDFVMCTHLHTDHVGWNTQARERPLGADLPEGALRVLRPRAGVLDQAREGRSRPPARGSPIPCCRSWPPTASTSSRARTPSTI